MRGLLTTVRDVLSSWTLPHYKRFRTARSMYEKRVAELFGRGDALPFPKALTDQARACPQLQEVERLYHECIEDERATGRVHNEGVVHYQLGILYCRQGRDAESQEELGQSLDLLEDYPGTSALGTVSACHYYLGQFDLAAGNIEQARKHFETSLAIDTSLNDFVGIRLGTNMLERCDACEEAAQ